MKTNHFEEEIDRQLLELVSNGNKDISEYIQKLPKKEQRARILSILDNDRGLFLKISKIIGSDEYIPKCDYILDVVSMIRQYVQVSETEKKRFGEVMTPISLVEEMLNKLPEDVWSNPHLNKNDKKVIISLSGKYAPYKEDGQIGFTDMCLAYIVRDGESLDGAFSVINSKLFHFVMNSNKWSGFNNKEIIRRFALPKLDKVYSDEDVYDFFALDDTERIFLNNWK